MQVRKATYILAVIVNVIVALSWSHYLAVAMLSVIHVCRDCQGQIVGQLGEPAIGEF